MCVYINIFNNFNIYKIKLFLLNKITNILNYNTITIQPFAIN